MKKLIYFLLLIAVTVFTQSCQDEEIAPRNDSTIIPAESFGRENITLGTIEVESRDLTISVYDHGQIDGDIVSIYANGDLVIDEQVLDGPFNQITRNVTLDYDGFNYILLYAHNEGSVSPNTCTLVIDDGVGIYDYVLDADLITNGAVNVIVN